MARILAIETSCDETSVAVVQGRRILSNVVSSQAAIHEVYQGVVPELASRAHMERIAGVVELALKQAFGAKSRLHNLKGVVEAVAFTQGPGLAGALLVGKVAAQTLSEAFGLPLVGVNHLEAHALAARLADPVPFPFLSLVVSGGHTELVWVLRPGRYRVLGRTRDDAAGEVFDKVAKLLKLGYPGGPIVDRLARRGDPRAVRFPRPLLPESWDFSFSGLKTAVLYHLRDVGVGNGKADVCASFQEAVVDTLVEKTLKAASHLGARRVALGGGVAANSRLREKFSSAAGALKVYFPPMSLCTDNAAMVAYVAAERLNAGRLPRRHAIDPSQPIRSWV